MRLTKIIQFARFQDTHLVTQAFEEILSLLLQVGKTRVLFFFFGFELGYLLQSFFTPIDNLLVFINFL